MPRTQKHPVADWQTGHLCYFRRAAFRACFIANRFFVFFEREVFLFVLALCLFAIINSV